MRFGIFLKNPGGFTWFNRFFFGVENLIVSFIPIQNFVQFISLMIESSVWYNYDNYTFNQGRSQNLKLGGAALLLVVCSDFGFRLRCYLVA